MKDSFLDFKSNVTVTATEDLQIEFKHPILLEDDVILLGYPRPPEVTQTGGETQWVYVFLKKNTKTGAKAAEVRLRLNFVDRRLSRVVIPRNIARLIPVDLPEAILTAIGKAKINWLDRSLIFLPRESDDPMNGVTLPCLDDCLEVLGTPFEDKEPTPTTRSLIYIYECDIGHKKMEFAFGGCFRQSFGAMMNATVSFGRYCVLYTSYSIEIQDMLNGPSVAEKAQSSP